MTKLERAAVIDNMLHDLIELSDGKARRIAEDAHAEIHDLCAALSPHPEICATLRNRV
jgi:hypothetical protein